MAVDVAVVIMVLVAVDVDPVGSVDMVAVTLAVIAVVMAVVMAVDTEDMVVMDVVYIIVDVDETILVETQEFLLQEMVQMTRNRTPSNRKRQRNQCHQPMHRVPTDQLTLTQRQLNLQSNDLMLTLTKKTCRKNEMTFLVEIALKNVVIYAAIVVVVAAVIVNAKCKAQVTVPVSVPIVKMDMLLPHYHILEHN